MQQLPEGLGGLAGFDQFILYKKIKLKNKITKIPVTSEGVKVTAHDTKHHMPITQALTLFKNLGEPYGVGFVLCESDPFFCVDIDSCLQSNNTWSKLAIDIMSLLPNAAMEVSQSHRGLHILGCATSVLHRCWSKDEDDIELYTEKRMIALTGINVTGNVLTNCNATFQTLVDRYFPPKENQLGFATWTTEADPEWYGLDDDDELIQKALRSKSGGNTFGTKASFRDLWTCDVDALSSAYPHSDEGYNHSEADSALAQHLAFWTGKNCERILTLMKRSALVREKWDRPGWLETTITGVVSIHKNVYTSGRKPVEGTEAIYSHSYEPKMLSGYQFSDVTHQLKHFKGCVYVRDRHCVLTPDGSFLNHERFNVVYGGYTFQLEADSNGKTTRRAWEAFTESQAVRFNKVQSTCFKTDMAFGEIVLKEKSLLVNTYIDLQISRIKGDPAPFLIHLKKLIPNTTDQNILLSYLAACVQYKGTKFKWAPLIQGVDGNGKTLLTRCVTYALGDRYVHYPPAHDISEKFNSWMFNNLLIGVEDIYIPNHRIEVMEVLKPMITGERLARRAMRTDYEMGDCVCNFIFNSQHKDGIRKTVNDRRYCVFFTVQQTYQDMIRTGLTNEYFAKLYGWLEDDGYPIVADFLTDYDIPDVYNPATLCLRAPHTSSNSEAVEVSLGAIEQEILEAISEERQGFCGGWISSMTLDKLLNETITRRNIPRNRRKEVLSSLGYQWHPGLPDGRVSRIIVSEGGKPRLFIKSGHIHANLKSGVEILKHYEEAQKYATPRIVPLHRS